MTRESGFVVQLDVTDRATCIVLEASFGTGEDASYFAWRGCKVMGIDCLEGPISSGGTGSAEF